MTGLFLANMWDEIFGEPLLKELDEIYGLVRGNWLSGSRQQLSPTGNLILYAPIMAANTIHWRDIPLENPILTWILYPDAFTGWDFESNCRPKVQLDLTELELRSKAVAVNSVYTLELVQYALQQPAEIISPVVDTGGKTPLPDQQASSTVRVVWNHMWRIQKDPLLAFDIIDKVAPLHPEVEFFVGRAFDWADIQHSPISFQYECQQKIALLRQKHTNVHLLSKLSRSEYIDLLHTADVFLSTAAEETYGLTVFEAAARGLAVIAPEIEVYPWLHSYAYLVPRSSSHLSEALDNILTDRQLLSSYQRASYEATDPLRKDNGAKKIKNFILHGSNSL